MRLRDLVEGEDRYQLYEWFDAYSTSFHYATKIHGSDYVNQILDGEDTSSYTVTLSPGVDRADRPVLKVPTQIARVLDFIVVRFEIADTLNWPECTSFAGRKLIGDTERVFNYCMERVEHNVELTDTRLSVDELLQLIGAGKYVRYAAPVYDPTGVPQQLFITHDEGMIEVQYNKNNEMHEFDNVFDLQAWLEDQEHLHAAFRS